MLDPISRASPSRLEVANLIKALVCTYYKRKMRAVFTEIGLNKQGRLRADVLALSMKGEVVIVECKSCISDYSTDKKMLGYLAYSHKMYLAVQEKVYNQIEIPKGIGVFIISDCLTKILKVKPARSRKIDQSIVHNLAIRAAFRSQDRTNRKNKCLQKIK